MRHIVLKHRPRPGDRARISAVPREGAPQSGPVLFWHGPPGHGIIARQARFAHEQVIAGGRKLLLFDIVPDMEQILFFMVQEIQIRPRGQAPQPLSQLRQPRLLPRILRKPGAQRGDAAEEVAAVHRGDIDRLHGAECPGVIPVEEVPPVFFQPLHRRERVVQPGEELPAADKAKIARSERAQHHQADIRR